MYVIIGNHVFMSNTNTFADSSVKLHTETLNEERYSGRFQHLYLALSSKSMHVSNLANQAKNCREANSIILYPITTLTTFQHGEFNWLTLPAVQFLFYHFPFRASENLWAGHSLLMKVRSLWAARTETTGCTDPQWAAAKQTGLTDKASATVTWSIAWWENINKIRLLAILN